MIILSKNRLLVADFVIDAREPCSIFLMPDDVGKIIILRPIGRASSVRQGIELELGKRDWTEKS